MEEALVPPAPMTLFALCQRLWSRGHPSLQLRGPPATYLGTGPGAVHDGVAAVEGEGVLQFGQALLRELVPGVDHPAIGLEPGAGKLSCPPPGPEQPLLTSAPGVHTGNSLSFAALSAQSNSRHLSVKGSQLFLNSSRSVIPTNRNHSAPGTLGLKCVRSGIVF